MRCKHRSFPTTCYFLRSLLVPFRSFRKVRWPGVLSPVERCPFGLESKIFRKRETWSRPFERELGRPRLAFQNATCSLAGLDVVGGQMTLIGKSITDTLGVKITLSDRFKSFKSVVIMRVKVVH